MGGAEWGIIKVLYRKYLKLFKYRDNFILVQVSKAVSQITRSVWLKAMAHEYLWSVCSPFKELAELFWGEGVLYYALNNYMYSFRTHKD